MTIDDHVKQITRAKERLAFLAGFDACLELCRGEQPSREVLIATSRAALQMPDETDKAYPDK
jgi:hypothetical protein